MRHIVTMALASAVMTIGAALALGEAQHVLEHGLRGALALAVMVALGAGLDAGGRALDAWRRMRARRRLDNA